MSQADYQKYHVSVVQGRLHKTHYLEGSQFSVDTTKFKEPCEFCNSDKVFKTRKEYIAHISNVHHKKRVRDGKVRIVFCKCSEGKVRGGALGRQRNGHFHCRLCHFPLQDRQCLGNHMVTQHGVKRDKLDPDLC